MRAVAVVTVVTLPPFPTADALEGAAERVRSLAGSNLPLAVVVPGRVWQHLSDWEVPPGPVEWLRAGWNEPDLTVLPEHARSLQLERESEALGGLSVEPSGLFTRTWDPTLVPTLLDHGIEYAVVPTDAPAPGVADRFDRVLTVIPATEGTDTPPPSDGLWVVVSPHPEDTAADLDARGFRLDTPGRYLAEHPPTGRLRPPPVSPAFASETADASSEVLYRRMLRIATHLGERAPSDAVAHVMETQHRALYPAPIEPRLRQEAHRSLLRARHLLDRRRRGESWTTIERLDWDADGSEEIEIESATLSLVLDPTAGRIVYLDDKTADWPVTAVPDDGDPGLVLARVLAPDAEPHVVSLPVVDAVEQRRGGATVRLATVDGDLGVVVVTEDSRLTLSYHLAGVGEMRIGPEMPLGLEATRMRVDGGEWRPVDTAVAASGHRFRFSDGERQVLMVMPVPGDCFARPLDPFGIVVWAHWPTGGSGDYELAVDFAP